MAEEKGKRADAQLFDLLSNLLHEVIYIGILSVVFFFWFNFSPFLGLGLQSSWIQIHSSHNLGVTKNCSSIVWNIKILGWILVLLRFQSAAGVLMLDLIPLIHRLTGYYPSFEKVGGYKM